MTLSQVHAGYPLDEWVLSVLAIIRNETREILRLHCDEMIFLAKEYVTFNQM
jgi:hypothetical protein